jgi:D-aspartate ligase
VKALLNKLEFQRIAEESGFPVPKAIAIRCVKDLQRLGELRFPAVIKPATKEFVLAARAPRACRVSSREEAEAACARILAAAPELIVQEWIDGEEADIYFCLQYRAANGWVVSSFTGRKLRCWPPQTGSTASCVAAPEADAELQALTDAFFKRVAAVGACSMEYKRVRGTGRFLMIEPTVGRTDWQEEVATLHGINIPLAAYRHEVGLAQEPHRENPKPIIWRDPAGYWRSAVVTASLRDRAAPGLGVKSACWRWDDPLPMAYFWLEWTRKALRRGPSDCLESGLPGEAWTKQKTTADSGTSRA